VQGNNEAGQKKQSLTKFTKTTASSGAKRIAKPKEAGIAEKGIQLVAEAEAPKNKKRKLSTGASRSTKPKKMVAHAIENVLQTFS
jgi:hypothetical protein